MEKKILEDRVIYRADFGKKLKLKGNNEVHSEIVLSREQDDRIVEVEK